jgi:hypothetical protein
MSLYKLAATPANPLLRNALMALVSTLIAQANAGVTGKRHSLG